jgi:transcriptional regulator with PAS, ATPase and Fis domain
MIASGDDAVGKDCREVSASPSGFRPFQGPQDSKQPEPILRLPGEGDESYLVTRIAAPVYDANRQVVGCLTILQDHAPIADLVNRIHHEERSLKLILDNLEVGIFTVDRGGRHFNTAAEKISARSAGDPVLRAIFEGIQEWICSQEIITSAKENRHRKPDPHLRGCRRPHPGAYLPCGMSRGSPWGHPATSPQHQLSQAIQDRYTFHDMVGNRDAAIFENVQVVAKIDATVLIEGPTDRRMLPRSLRPAGAGKPLVKELRRHPDTLLESEMFGYARGLHWRSPDRRFSGRRRRNHLLDEIDLPLALQAKLLRVIEEKVFASALQISR